MHKIEPTRTRKHGTRVTTTKDGAAIVEACRSIVANGQYEKINGHMVDLFTASAIVKVHDALSDTSKPKLLALPVARMASIAFQVLK
jgi:hypothetical protein